MYPTNFCLLWSHKILIFVSKEKIIAVQHKAWKSRKIKRKHATQQLFPVIITPDYFQLLATFIL